MGALGNGDQKWHTVQNPVTKNSKGDSKIGLKKQIKDLYWRMTQAKQKGTKWPGKMEKRHSDQNERREVQKW